MAGKVKFWLTDDAGRQIAPIVPVDYTATRVVNGVGSFSMTLPASFDRNLVAPDRDWMVQLWYTPPGSAGGFLWRSFFILGRKQRQSAKRYGLKINGPCQNHLLTRRSIAHYAGSANASTSATEADDAMKDVVTDAIADGANPAPDAGTRVWSSLSVQGDLTNGPQITKDYSWKQVLTLTRGGVLSTMAKAARELGTEVFFDVAVSSVSTESISYEFRTYTGQPGADLSSGTNQVVFKPSHNLRGAELDEDYWDCTNYVWGAGQGDDDDRKIVQVYEATRYNRSQWGRCESVYDGRSQSDDALEDGAYEKLSEGRPKVTPRGTPIDTARTRFGRDWRDGDKVRVAMFGQEFDAIIWSATISGGQRKQTNITTKLEYR